MFARQYPKHFTQIADNYSLVFVIFINFFGQQKDSVVQVLFAAGQWFPPPIKLTGTM